MVVLNRENCKKKGVSPMHTNQIKKIDSEVFSALHYDSIEEAGAEMLYLAACTKLSEYMSEEVFYEAKYELCFEEFKNKYIKKRGRRF